MSTTNLSLAEQDAIMKRVMGDAAEPEFCSLDEIVDLPDDHSDPYYLVLRQEERSGIPMAFQRDCDEAIRYERFISEQAELDLVKRLGPKW